MGGINFVVHDSTNVVELFKAMNGMDMASLNPHHDRPRRSTEYVVETSLQMLSALIFLTLAVMAVMRNRKTQTKISRRSNRNENIFIA